MPKPSLRPPRFPLTKRGNPSIWREKNLLRLTELIYMCCTDSGGIFDADPKDDSFDIAIVFYSMNVGETEATLEKVEAKIITKHRDVSLSRNQVLQDCTPENRNLLPPRFAISTVRRTITRGDRDSILKGDIQICCIGCVRYKDGRGAL